MRAASPWRRHSCLPGRDSSRPFSVRHDHGGSRMWQRHWTYVPSEHVIQTTTGAIEFRADYSLVPVGVPAGAPCESDGCDHFDLLRSVRQYLFPHHSSSAIVAAAACLVLSVSGSGAGCLRSLMVSTKLETAPAEALNVTITLEFS